MITIIEGGARLCVIPFSYSEKGKNKVCYLEPPEGKLFPSEFLLTLESTHENVQIHMNSLQKLWHVCLFRLWIGFQRWWKFMQTSKSGMRGLPRFAWFVRNSVPFFAADYPKQQFEFPRQLVVHDPAGLTDTKLLVPSQKWLELSIDTWTKTGSESAAEQEDKEKFDKWKKSQLEKGLKIGYLVSPVA